MGYINMLVAINIIDVRAMIASLEEGNPTLALEILQDISDDYDEELEDVTEYE